MTGELHDLFGIDIPVLLGPFGGLSSVALAAAVSEGGGLGSFGLYGYAPERIADTIAQLNAATSRPSAVNLWLPTGSEVTPTDVDLAPLRDALAPLFTAAGVEAPADPATFLPSIDAQLEAVWGGAPAVLSVVFGVPGGAVVAEAHRRGIRVVGTATSVAEAVALAELAAGVPA